MKPLMYGYMKVQPGTPDNDVRQMELVLKDYAEREGYCFAAMFYEEDDGRASALSELIEELKRSEARHVVMPTLAHLSSHSIIRRTRLDLIKTDAGAQVHTLTSA